MTAETKKRLGEILRDAGLVDEFQVNTALNEQKRWGGKLGEHLIRLGYTSEDAILDVLRNQLKIPTVNLKKVRIPDEVIKLVPVEVAKKNNVLPVGVKNLGGKDHLILAMSDPFNLAAVDDVQFRTKLKVMPALAGIITLERAIRFYYDQHGDLFEETQGGADPFSPVTIRERVDITEGSQTFTQDSIEKRATQQRTTQAAPSAPSPGAAFGPPEDPAQIRAELTALRDLLLEKGILDRKSFIERVVQEKIKK